MITSFFLDIWLDYGLALEIEEIFDLLSHGRHDGRIEERIETCEQECADDDCDEDLDAGVDVAFSLYIFDCDFGADCHFGCLVLDISEKLLHK